MNIQASHFCSVSFRRDFNHSEFLVENIIIITKLSSKYWGLFTNLFKISPGNELPLGILHTAK